MLFLLFFVVFCLFFVCMLFFGGFFFFDKLHLYGDTQDFSFYMEVNMIDTEIQNDLSCKKKIVNL